MSLVSRGLTGIILPLLFDVGNVTQQWRSYRENLFMYYYITNVTEQQ